MRLHLSLFLLVSAPGRSLFAQPAAVSGYEAKADSIVQSYAEGGLYRGAIVVVKDSIC